MKTQITAIAALLALSLPIAAQDVVEREGEPDIITAESDDVRMENASAQARAQLDRFFEIYDTASAAQKEFFVIKACLPTVGSAGLNNECIWVDGLERDGNSFSGRLANEPYDLAVGLTYGSPVDFGLDQVSDWAYLDGMKFRGHYTTRILAEAYPLELRTEYLANFHDDPNPRAE